jgi:thioredoxin-dependent peroxiredoxin
MAPSGTRLPDFDLATGGGKRVSSDGLRGRRTVLYFYPKDDTPGCTVESQEFTKLYPDFRARGVDVFGVSPDSEKSHDRFASKCGLGIPLVSDPERVLIESLGLWREKKFMGRTYMGVERSTFLIGPDGAVEREWRGVKAPGHAAEVLEAVSAES